MDRYTEIFNRKDIENVDTQGNTNKKARNAYGEAIIKKLAIEKGEVLDNDILLLLFFWKETRQIDFRETEDGYTIYIHKNKLSKMTKPETISRIRRKLKKEGEIGYSEETEYIREHAIKDYKEYYGKSSE